MNTIDLGIRPLARKPVSKDPWLLENVSASGQKDSYEIIAADFLVSGGESQIYRAKRLSDGETLLAKVYTTSSGGPKKRDEREDIRKEILKMKDPVSCGLLPLLDVVRIKNSREDSADVDIIPFCENGRLDVANYQQLRGWVIRDLLKALNYIHGKNWVHRDIKPENIYVLEHSGRKTAVLGDFGTIVRVSSDERVTNQTEIKRGTPGYTAREIRVGYSKKASDYFSLGCTIATLYHQGKHVYANVVDAGDDATFHRLLADDGLPLNCPDQEADLQVLVNALTLEGENDRAGYADVEQWLDKPEEFVKKWKSCRQGMGRKFRVRFEEHDYFSEKDLTEGFLQNWEAALDFFYEDDMFAGYIRENGHSGCNELHHIQKDPPRNKLEKEFGFARFLHFFNKPNEYVEPPIYWRSHKYTLLSEIPVAVRAEKGENAVDILDLLRSGLLSWKLAITKPEDRETLETVKGIEKYAKTQPVLALDTFLFLMDDAAKQEERTTEQIVSDVLSNREIFYKLCVSYCEKSTYLQTRPEIFSAVFAPLIQKGHSAGIFELANTLAGEPDRIKRVITAYLTFESICTDKSLVRRYFYERGPHAHLHWLTKNIDLYEISSDEMRDTASKIKAFTFSDTTPISEQLKSFISLKALRDEFYDNYQTLILNTALGDMCGKTVKAKVLDAFFIPWNDDWAEHNLFGEKETPIGFIRTLGYIPNKDIIENNITKILGNAASEVTFFFNMTKILDNAASEVTDISDASVQHALDRISGGLSWLFEMYCTNEMWNGDVVQYAVDTVNNTRNGNSRLGKVIAEATSPAYFHLRLCNMIDPVLQRLVRKPSLRMRMWDEMRSRCQNAFGHEYDRLLHSHIVSYDVLARRCPDDYRPIWFALREKTADFDADRLFRSIRKLRDAKDNFNREEKQFDSAVHAIQSKKISQIGRGDFIRIIRCARSAQKAWERMKEAFDFYNREFLPELNAAKAKAGADAPALESVWNHYIASIDAYKSTDFLSQISYWTGEMWEAEGLCRYCGGKLGLFGKCKNCGMKTS